VARAFSNVPLGYLSLMILRFTPTTYTSAGFEAEQRLALSWAKNVVTLKYVDVLIPRGRPVPLAPTTLWTEVVRKGGAELNCHVRMSPLSADAGQRLRDSYSERGREDT
jgi:hypothetical protein